jgi:3-dehydroquinate dehydratase-2
VPAVEVHISNIHAREEFRSKSVTARAARGVIAGLGFTGYLLAMEYLVDLDQ